MKVWIILSVIAMSSILVSTNDQSEESLRILEEENNHVRILNQDQNARAHPRRQQQNGGQVHKRQSAQPHRRTLESQQNNHEVRGQAQEEIPEAIKLNIAQHQHIIAEIRNQIENEKRQKKESQEIAGASGEKLSREELKQLHKDYVRKYSTGGSSYTKSKPRESNKEEKIEDEGTFETDENEDTPSTVKP